MDQVRQQVPLQGLIHTLYDRQVPTAPSGRVASTALLFDLDGTLYVGDLPILAFARHCAEQLSDHGATHLIDNVRYFLEGKSAGDRLVDLGAAQDGDDAVEILAAAAGLTPDRVAAAHRAARADLAGSAFALEAPDGLLGLLESLHTTHVMVVTNAEVGVAEVLAAIGVAGRIHQVITAVDKPAAMPAIIDATLHRIGADQDPQRMMVVGDRWRSDLADAHRRGAETALVDRFGRGDGTPTLRAADLASLVPGIRNWADRYGGAR